MNTVYPGPSTARQVEEFLTRNLDQEPKYGWSVFQVETATTRHKNSVRTVLNGMARIGVVARIKFDNGAVRYGVVKRKWSPPHAGIFTRSKP